MRKIRKILLSLAFAILLFLGCLLGFLKFGESRSYRTPVPEDATAIVRIDMHRIYKSVLWEYWRRKKSGKKPPLKGIDIPANIFIYTVKGRQASTWFTSLPVDNPRALQSTLQNIKELIPSGTAAAGIHLWKSRDGRWTVAYKEHRIVLSYSVNREETVSILCNVLMEHNTIAVGRSRFKSIRDQDGHVTFLSGDNTGSLDFDKGTIQADLSLNMNRSLPATVAHRSWPAGTALALWLHADMRPFLEHRVFSPGGLTIEGDSLLTPGPQGIELAITQPVMQFDTVVSYEYNDDFEKIPVTSVSRHAVPGLSLWYKNGSSLYAYLRRQGAIDGDSGIVSRKAFPLYALHAFNDSDYLRLSTGKESITMPLEKSNQFFSLSVHFEPLLQLEDMRPLAGLLKPFKTLEASGTGKGTRAVFKSVLIFKDKSRNALLQLADVLGP